MASGQWMGRGQGKGCIYEAIPRLRMSGGFFFFRVESSSVECLMGRPLKSVINFECVLLKMIVKT